MLGTQEVMIAEQDTTPRNEATRERPTRNGITQPSSLLKRALRIEWLGQTVASLCWIVSVFAYGISSSGDWLQLCAASCWLVANMAALLSNDSE